MSMKNASKGFTLVELIVSIGLFALVMLLSSSAYLLMIGINRQAQSTATGINNLSFALETMTRTIRTGTEYSCGFTLGLGDCAGGGEAFSVKDTDGSTITYTLSGGKIFRNYISLTDPAVQISSLTFYVSGTAKNDATQPRVTIVVSGTVSSGPGKTESFTVQTGATMRGSDL